MKNDRSHKTDCNKLRINPVARRRINKLSSSHQTTKHHVQGTLTQRT
jgi:hypothetical protein